MPTPSPRPSRREASIWKTKKQRSSIYHSATHMGMRRPAPLRWSALLPPARPPSSPISNTSSPPSGRQPLLASPPPQAGLCKMKPIPIPNIRSGAHRTKRTKKPPTTLTSTTLCAFLLLGATRNLPRLPPSRRPRQVSNAKSIHISFDARAPPPLFRLLALVLRARCRPSPAGRCSASGASCTTFTADSPDVSTNGR